MFNLRSLIVSLLFLLSPVAYGDVIAFAQDNMANDFRRAQVMDARQAAEQANIPFIYTDAQGKTSLLIRQIDKFIRQQVDVLIVGTNDADAVVPAVEKAHQAGIRVIILDRGVNTDQYSAFLNSDNVAIGETAGRYIADQLQGRGQVLLLEGIQTADVTLQRSEGFLNVMARNPEISVIRRTGNYLRKDALIEMEKLLAEGIHVDAIFSESDSMLSGVRPVMKRNGIDPSKVIMIGVDYTSEARMAIISGEQTGSVLFPLGGREAVDVAVQLLSGKAVASHIIIPADTLVTESNVDQIKPIF